MGNAQGGWLDVSSAVEMQVVPDEIHIAIELRERGSGNNKVTVEQQELQLRDAVVPGHRSPSSR